MAIFALVEHQFDPAGASAPTQDPAAFGGQKISMNCTAFGKGAYQSLIRGTIDLDMIRFVDVTHGIRKTRGPFGVVCEQQQAFTGSIQTTYRRNERPSGTE